jgi:hypothetical protein
VLGSEPGSVGLGLSPERWVMAGANSHLEGGGSVGLVKAAASCRTPQGG